MYLFIENGIRGGFSTISHRYAKANHLNYKSEGYHYNKFGNEELFHFDTTNLYGFVISVYLPISNSNWRDPDVYYLNDYRIPHIVVDYPTLVKC